MSLGIMPMPLMLAAICLPSAATVETAWLGIEIKTAFLCWTYQIRSQHIYFYDDAHPRETISTTWGHGRPQNCGMIVPSGQESDNYLWPWEPEGRGLFFMCPFLTKAVLGECLVWNQFFSKLTDKDTITDWGNPGLLAKIDSFDAEVPKIKTYLTQRSPNNLKTEV